MALALAASVVAGAVLPAMAAADGAGIRGACPWMEFTRLPGVSTYPDTDTEVYQCVYTAGPLHDTVIDGVAPHARFWSFAVEDQARREIASLPDSQIQLRPDGSYAIRIALDCAGAPNCLSLGAAAAPLGPGLIYYRVYVPDGDEAGGVPLPRVSYEVPGAPGQTLDLGADGPIGSAYAGATAGLEPGGGPYEALADPSGLEQPVPAGKTGADPQPDRYRGLGAKQLDTLAQDGVPAPAIEVLAQALGSGGFGATADNAYETMSYDMTKGNVVVSAKAPTYLAQHSTAANDLGEADGSQQVRYWSLCTTQVTRPVDCIRDEQAPVDANGFFQVIIAPSCPVAGYALCLRSGVASAAGPGQAATLLYRNTLASQSFYDPDGPRTCPTLTQMFCGDYALQARYVPRP